MNSRERVIAAIEYQNPDRMPFMMYGEDPDNKDLNDIIWIGVGGYSEGCLPGRNIDNWHCEWLNLIAPKLGQVVGHPLENPSALSSYIPPDPMDLDINPAKEVAEKRDDKYLILGYISLFERLVNLRGFENLLVDIAFEEEHFFQMRDMVLAYNLKLIDRLLALNPDAIYLADDWGSQISLMIDPKAWRKLFLPAYQQMINRVRNKGKHVFFHTDGYIMPIFPDLIEAGVQAFWVEFGPNSIDELAKYAKGKAAFQALLDTQYLECLPLDELRDHAKHCYRVLGGPQGGFIVHCECDDPIRNQLVYGVYKEISYGFI